MSIEIPMNVEIPVNDNGTTIFMVTSIDCEQKRLIVDCARQYTTSLPFIGTSQESFLLRPKQVNDEWNGVQCSHSDEKKSPHLIGTHIESSRHVLGDAPPIKKIFQDNPRYLIEMDGIHLKVTPEEQKVTEIKHPNTNKQTILFSGGESYSIPLEMHVGSLETIVTKASLQTALGEQIPKEGSVLLLQFDGCENNLTNWPYLTNDAVAYIYDLKISIVALNIPSIDRERDGGKTSNHKLLFQNPNNLIIESAQFSQLPTGPVTVELHIDSANMDVDCVPCDHLFVESAK